MNFLPRLLNTLAVAAVTALCVMLVARYYLPLAPSAAVGVTAGVALGAVVMILSSRRKKTNSERDAALRRALLRLGKSGREEFLYQSLLVRTQVERVESGLLVTHDKKTVVLVDRYRYAALNGDDVLAIASEESRPVIILCDTFDKTASEAAHLTKAKIWARAKVVELLDNLHAYPKIPPPEPKKGRLRRLAAVALHPCRTKAYLLTAFVLLTTSLITPYRFYYLAFAATVCVLAGVAIADPFRARDST